MQDEQRVHDAVSDVFDRYLGGDGELIEEIRSFGDVFHVEQDSWRFRLPHLYELISRYDPAIREMGYKRFRNLLYRLPINRQLARRGAEVVVAESMDKVDENTYLLRKVNSAVVAAGLEGK